AAVTVFGVGFALVRRFSQPASAKGSGIIVPQYTVPKDLTVLEAAELIRRQHAGVAAQIVSLAVRRNLRILDYPVKTRDARYSVQLLSLDGLAPGERSLVEAVFGGLNVGEVRE